MEGYDIDNHHREKLMWFLNQFYARLPKEKYTIMHAVKAFKSRITQEKLDAWVAVCGATGVGKSYFILMFMILLGRRMNLQRNIAYIPQGDEIEQKFNTMKKGMLLIDEAAKHMRSVYWQDKKQQKVNTTAMTDRYKQNIVFLNMPNFKEFTKSMRQTNLRFRFLILYRTNLYARVVLQRISKNWRSDDPWNDRLVSAIFDDMEKKGKQTDNESILAIERKLPTTVLDFLIPNLEVILPDVTSAYQTLKEASRIEVDTEKEDKIQELTRKLKELEQNFVKTLCYNTLQIGSRRVTRADVAAAVGVSEGRLTKIIHEIAEKSKGGVVSNEIENLDAGN